MSAFPPLTQAFPRLSLAAKLNLSALAAGIAALCVLLWPEWKTNPDLSHGFFMPLLFVLLLHESRRDAAPWYPAGGIGTWLAFFALLVAGICTLGAAGLYAAALGWSHALVHFMLASALALLLAAALLAFSHRSVRLIGLNWSAWVAVGLWVLCAPLPPGTYSRLTMTLQLWVSEGVLSTLHLLGVAAIRHGNIIHMANSTVGIEEACSGVRSLISCVFAGLFFSATLVSGPWARALIILLSVPLALGMNFLRSLALTLMANAGVDISGTWHDLTGFAVLGLTAAALGGLALALERGERPAARPPAPEASSDRTPALQRALGAGFAVAVAMVLVFALNTRPAARPDAPVPDLMALMPASPPGWQVRTTDLYEFAGTLQTEHLAQRRYAREDPAGPLEITFYIAYWRAGQAPVSLVASHTPDACWPGSGWTAMPTERPRMRFAAGGRTLPPAESRLFQAGDRPQHVWFWHLYDGNPIFYGDPYSPVELLNIAMRFGFRRGGDQVFVRVSSNRPWNEIANEPVLTEFFANTGPLGL